MTTRSSCASGFTLIELLIIVAIISVTLSVSPTRWPIVERYQVKTQANHVLNAVMYTRHQAISDGQSVFLCPSKTGLTCDKNWSDKILVYRNNNDDKGFDGDDELLRIFDIANDTSQIRWGSFKNKQYLEIKPSGMTNYQNGTFTVCADSKKPETAIPIIVNVAGRPYFGRDRNNDGIREYSSGKPVVCT